MSNVLNRHQIGAGIFFSSFTDKKFKHNRLTINFITPLSPENASDNAMVPLLLRKGSRNLPDFSKLHAKLNRLYGASLGISISKFNVYQKVGLTISFLDNRYAMEQEDLIDLCGDLLIDLVFNPNLDSKGEFIDKQVDLERQYLLDTIESEINDKRTYSILRMVEEMYKDEPISVPKYGTIETAKAVTGASVVSAWKRLLSTASVEIMFTGAGQSTGIDEKFKLAFEEIERSPIGYAIQRLSTEVERSHKLSESMENLQQGKLVMGMRISGLESVEEVSAARVFGAIYGGTPFSKLFLNVREKLSLCYYCAARVDAVNNLLTVDSGVEFENMDKAEKEILVQLDEIKNSNITEDELKNTNLLLSTAIENVNDSLSSIEDWYFSQILKGENTSPEQDIENLSKVTIAQVVKIANQAKLDTVYRLVGKENS